MIKKRVGTRTSIDISGKIIIEGSATISMNSFLLIHQDSGELRNRPMAKHYPKKISNVVVKRGAYIGANTIILPGVTIEEMSVVGAGSVVTKHFPT